MSESPLYPKQEWEYVSPAAVGMDGSRLQQAREWLEGTGRKMYRVVIVRGGRVVAEWNAQVGRDERLRLASAAKSIYSCMLGMAIEEGRIASLDARLVEYYPEAMDVEEGRGPKEGRYAFPKDRDITFRQLISNTSGYMKPGEEPGKVFHYQTFGMNVLAHAVAKTYGLYSADDPRGSPGLRRLMKERIAGPIGADWDDYLSNFDHPAGARVNIFGYYQGVLSTALDMARLGWLWRHGGLWEGEYVVPNGWIERAARVAPDIVKNCPRDRWKYGYGFWTNERGVLWPGLPTDSYAACGAGRQMIWVCPGLDLVVVQSPGVYEEVEDEDGGFLKRVVAACSGSGR